MEEPAIAEIHEEANDSLINVNENSGSQTMEESASAEIKEEANDLVINVNENSESQMLEESARAEIQEKANDLVINVNENFESQRVAKRVLADDIKKMIGSSEPPSSDKCCIYTVPHDLRKVNEQAYAPQVISIGPFHHGDKTLETKEKIKKRYLNRFLQNPRLNVEDLVSTIKNMEKHVRSCYAETSELSSDNYVKMIMLDASFIIVFMLISVQHEEWSDNIIQRWMHPICKDMRLLENQLPFFVIEKLYNLAYASTSNYPSITELTFKFFNYYNTQKIPHDADLYILHFVDLLRTFLTPFQRLEQTNRCKNIARTHTASELHEAGVKFKPSPSKCLFDLKFTSGKLEIPFIELQDSSESTFRNIMALEQCHYLHYAYVTDYFLVLNSLIDTTKDVDLLVGKGILNNCLDDSNKVTTLVNSLCKEIITPSMNTDYCRLCDDLNLFYKVSWHKWKATLRQDYFSTPWRIASTVAAIILLVLTFIQTVRSFY